MQTPSQYNIPELLVFNVSVLDDSWFLWALTSHYDSFILG